MKNSRSEYTANNELKIMQFHKQYKLQPAKISNPSNDYSGAVVALIGAIAIISTVILMVMALFNVI